MSYGFYKALHFFGIFTIMVSLGGMCLHVVNGGTRNFATRKWVSLLHGIGMLAALTGGFGLLARLGLATNQPGWSYAKIGIWLVLGAYPAFVYRLPKYARAFWIGLIVLGTMSGWLAINKPF